MINIEDDQFEDGNMVVSSSTIRHLKDEYNRILDDVDTLKAAYKEQLEPLTDALKFVRETAHDHGVPNLVVKNLVAEIRFERKKRMMELDLDVEDRDVLYYARQIIAGLDAPDMVSLPAPKSSEDYRGEKSNAEALDDILGV